MHACKSITFTFSVYWILSWVFIFFYFFLSSLSQDVTCICAHICILCNSFPVTLFWICSLSAWVVHVRATLKSGPYAKDLIRSCSFFLNPWFLNLWHVWQLKCFVSVIFCMQEPVCSLAQVNQEAIHIKLSHIFMSHSSLWILLGSICE